MLRRRRRVAVTVVLIAVGLGDCRARRRGVGPSLATHAVASRRAGGVFDRGHERRDGRRPAHAGGVRTRSAGRQPRRRQGHAGGKAHEGARHVAVEHRILGGAAQGHHGRDRHHVGGARHRQGAAVRTARGSGRPGCDVPVRSPNDGGGVGPEDRQGGPRRPARRRQRLLRRRDGARRRNRARGGRPRPLLRFLGLARHPRGDAVQPADAPVDTGAVHAGGAVGTPPSPNSPTAAPSSWVVAT